jgi:hypothetical protein
MASFLLFEDDEGEATLTNGYPAPGDRFAAWKPHSPMKGVEAETLADGTLHVFKFHHKYTVTFELRHIPQNQVATALRLIRWLNEGGEVTVNTGDADGNVYVCQKLMGSEPELRQPDPQNLRRTLKLELRNTEQADLICTWP